MKYIKPMQAKEFADLLLTLKTGDCIEFGTCVTCDWPNEIPESYDVECWYFAKVMCIQHYESRFILLDYCGGEEAFAIPLNCYKDSCDEDDKCIVPDYVNRFFANCVNLGHADDYVFVEMEDDE